MVISIEFCKLRFRTHLVRGPAVLRASTFVSGIISSILISGTRHSSKKSLNWGGEGWGGGGGVDNRPLPPGSKHLIRSKNFLL